MLSAVLLATLMLAVHFGDAVCIEMGVNLGGWLVLEPWMSRDSEFMQHVPRERQVVPHTEFAYSKWLRENSKTPMIGQHRNRFVTIDTLISLQARGVKFLRVPLGHWVSATATRCILPYICNKLGLIQRVDWLMNQTSSRGMKVMLSMHAARGSQNGFDHSSPVAPGTASFCTSRNTSTNWSHTLAAMREWATRWGRHQAFMGIGLLNEPTCNTTVLTTYYDMAYSQLRAIVPNALLVISPHVHKQGGDVRKPAGDQDADELRHWAAWGVGKTNVALDLHVYQTDFGLGSRHSSMSVQDHLAYPAAELAPRLRAYTAIAPSLPLVIYEWSTAGPNYNWNDRPLTFRQMNQFHANQVAAFNSSGVIGHAFWSSKVDGNEAWSFLRAQSG